MNKIPNLDEDAFRALGESNYVNCYYIVTGTVVMWPSEFKVTATITSFITDFDQFLETSQKAKAEKMNIFTILAILQFVSGDLIGWNRARNTVYKSRMNGHVNRKSNLTPLMDQYNTFRLVKNVEDDIQEKIMKYMKRKQQQPSRQNRRKMNFRHFHKLK